MSATSRIDDTVRLIGRRKAPINSKKRASSNSVEIPERNPTVDMVEPPAVVDNCSNAIGSHSPRVRLLAQCIAELLGTAIVIVFGCSGVAQYVVSRGTLSSVLSINFAFGFGVMIAIYVAGPVSGAHLNPAVSIALLTLGSMGPLQCLAYVLSQIIGAFIAAAMVFGIYYNGINKFDGGIRQVTGNESTAGIFATYPTQGITHISLFFDQVLSTALLLIAIGSLSNKRNKFVKNSQIPLIVGLIIVAMGVAFDYNCGYPINPARDLGPRLLTLCAGYGKEVFSAGNYYFWIPIVGPVVGAIVGAWIYKGYSKLTDKYIVEEDSEESA